MYKEDKLRREEESRLRGNIKGLYVAPEAKPDLDERSVLKSQVQILGATHYTRIKDQNTEQNTGPL
jgi:hypothetical protein